MTAIQLTLFAHQTLAGESYQHVHIELVSPDHVIEPANQQGVELPSSIQYDRGIVLEGRVPVWLYSYLTHLCHPAVWVGCYDPRLAGAVVTQSHVHGVTVGQVLKLDLP
jgi:CRISPR-associated protein Csx3